MRPIEKKKVGETVNVLYSDGTTKPHTIRYIYKEYGEAKGPLVANMGEYCSYCENNIDEADLTVEHIEPQSLSDTTKLPYYRHHWNNFLISCRLCNSVKSKKHYLPSETHLPHNNNTFLSLSYLTGGIVMVNPMLTGKSKQHAENLVMMTGLNRFGSNCSPKDKRWIYRNRVWNIALTDLQDYVNKKITVERVIKDAKAHGFWSVWFTLFKGQDLVLKRLITDFEGTCTTCFDASNHYEPISRPSNKGNTDPI